MMVRDLSISLGLLLLLFLPQVSIANGIPYEYEVSFFESFEDKENPHVQVTGSDPAHTWRRVRKVAVDTGQITPHDYLFRPDDGMWFMYVQGESDYQYDETVTIEFTIDDPNIYECLLFAKTQCSASAENDYNFFSMEFKIGTVDPFGETENDINWVDGYYRATDNYCGSINPQNLWLRHYMGLISVSSVDKIFTQIRYYGTSGTGVALDNIELLCKAVEPYDPWDDDDDDDDDNDGEGNNDGKFESMAHINKSDSGRFSADCNLTGNLAGSITILIMLCIGYIAFRIGRKNRELKG